MGAIKRKVSRKFSGIFASRVPLDGVGPASSSTPVLLSTTPARNRAFSRTSRTGGSAYGYSGSYRARLPSTGTLGNLSARRGSTAARSYRRRQSNANTITGEGLVSSSFASGTDLNFAQRLLMANENAVTNIADLWVAAAMNVDNEDPFESEDEGQQGYYDDEQPIEDLETDIFTANEPSRSNQFLRSTSFGSPSVRSQMSGTPFRSSTPQRHDSPNPAHPSYSLQSVTSGLEGTQTPSRRFSTTVPSIFTHVGVRTPPAVIEAQQLLALADEAEAAGQDTLPPIREGSRLSESDIEPGIPAQEPTLMSQLPLLIIFQYGILALHSTTHDQVFYLYLVS